jgi:hypothetical protein
MAAGDAEAACGLGGGGAPPGPCAVHFGQVFADGVVAGGGAGWDLDDNGALAARLREAGREFGGAGADHLFVELGELSADDRFGIAEGVYEVGERGGKATGAFEEDEHGGRSCRFGQAGAALSAAFWKESEEEDFGRFEAGDGEGGGEGRRPRDGEDWHGAAVGFGNEAGAGVGDGRGAGVADKGDNAIESRAEDVIEAALDVVLGEAEAARGSGGKGEDAGGGAGVFGGDEGGGAEDCGGSWGQVLEVADGRGDDVEAGREVSHWPEGAVLHITQGVRTDPC